ncbi:50S ribosomal protein L10 [endosymbiont of Euscepes postfasciatus]|uniref:50S ribosomal protein L10 n=1 Tax=endosymbiont of Euscepes postfasciatus TaxID=650377 RepID=UPI000DC71DDB|nr:50S ribosomal protein L10 [endosymbiont of Euscepes postfasciatus]BBA84701.1 50S ribosomal protein L10 [endosymbiont of Euscepes postfasciatus]
MNNKNFIIKKNIIDKFDILFTKFKIFFFININNMPSRDINIFRKNLKKNNSVSFFIKKTLLNNYFKKNKLNNLINLNIFEQNLIIFSNEDVLNIVKFLVNFINIINISKISYLYYNKNIYDTNYIKYLYNIPTYEKSIFNLVIILKYLSIGKFLNLLHIINKKH